MSVNSENVVLNMITRVDSGLASLGQERRRPQHERRERLETAYLGLGAVPCPEY